MSSIDDPSLCARCSSAANLRIHFSVTQDVILLLLFFEYQCIIHWVKCAAKPFYLLWICLLLFSGCGLVSSDEMPSESFIERSQIIVKFSDAMSEQTVKSRLDQMGAELGYRFYLLRPMSGNAYVIVVRKLSSEQLQKLLNNLNVRKDIEYAVEDSVMQPLYDGGMAPPPVQ